MQSSNNTNILSLNTLASPAAVKGKYPLTPELISLVVRQRRRILDVFERKSNKKILITGPCSIHNIDAAMEYARRLNFLQQKISDKIICVMRVYFEKPRTTLGWKGLIYDPDMCDDGNIEKGLFMARKLLLDILNLNVAIATEMLDPIIPQYIADSIAWAAIGARTSESQIHRQLSSGLSMPIGFKNSTDGSIDVALNAIKTAQSPHSFIGVDESGRLAVFNTAGNKYGHLVMRGGDRGSNFSAEYIAFAKVLMQKSSLTPNIIIDCSHANSNKDHNNQSIALRNILKQWQASEDCITGVMLESNLKSGSQNIKDKDQLAPDISVTDACISWEDTEALALEMYDSLK